MDSLHMQALGSSWCLWWSVIAAFAADLEVALVVLARTETLADAVCLAVAICTQKHD